MCAANHATQAPTPASTAWQRRLWGYPPPPRTRRVATAAPHCPTTRRPSPRSALRTSQHRPSPKPSRSELTHGATQLSDGRAPQHPLPAPQTDPDWSPGAPSLLPMPSCPRGCSPLPGGWVPRTPVFPRGCQMSGARAAPHPAPPRSNVLTCGGRSARSTSSPAPARPSLSLSLPGAPGSAGPTCRRRGGRGQQQQSLAERGAQRAGHGQRRPRGGCAAPEPSEAPGQRPPL